MCPSIKPMRDAILRTILTGAVIALALIIARRPLAAQRGIEWPTHGWRTSSPEAQGVDSRALAEMVNAAREQHIPIHSLVIVRHGRVVLTATFYPYHEAELHDIASATKSVTATLVGVAIGKHQLSDVRQSVLPLFADRSIGHRDPRKDAITLQDLLAMTSGLACEFTHGETTQDEMRKSADWTQFVLDLPMAAAPGSTFAYCSPGMHLLSSIVSRATGVSALQYAQREVFGPLGITDVIWPADPHGVTHGWGDLHLRPLDMAKLGFLWLHHGRWENRQLIPAAWMRDALAQHSAMMGSGYGYGIWVYPDRTPPMFEANGRGGQRIIVIPDKDVVVVMAGGGLEPNDLAMYLWQAIKSDGRLSDNDAALHQLHAAVASAAAPPEPTATASLPALATQVSGKRYQLDENALGLTTLSLTFNSNDAQVELAFVDGHRERRPVALNGVPRLSADGRFGLPVAVSGNWERPDVFVLTYDEVANINAFEFRLAFSAQGVTVGVKERTGQLNAQFQGR